MLFENFDDLVYIKMKHAVNLLSSLDLSIPPKILLWSIQEIALHVHARPSRFEKKRAVGGFHENLENIVSFPHLLAFSFLIDLFASFVNFHGFFIEFGSLFACNKSFDFKILSCLHKSIGPF